MSRSYPSLYLDELRTPLNAILGFAQLMETGTPVPTPSQKRNLDQILKDASIDTVIVCGALTNACCESTARDAAALGYRVLFAADATATRSDFEHNAALVNLMQFVADVRTVDQILQLLRGEHADDPQWDLV